VAALRENSMNRLRISTPERYGMTGSSVGLDIAAMVANGDGRL